MIATFKQFLANTVTDGRSTQLKIPLSKYLKHVVEEIELDDRLALDEVVHHGRVDVTHDVGADSDDQTFQEVDLFSRK